MKLRNKKTGEIIDLEQWRLEYYKDSGCITLTNDRNQNEQYCYVSFADLKDDWSDYIAPEPLIKDEKIRKAVRAWADANDLLTFKVVNEHFDCFKIIGYGDHNISSRIEFKSTIAHANKDQFYSIAELCGEEGE